MTAQLQPAIIGATGYSGLELMRILLKHPGAKTPVLLAREEKGGTSLNDVYPHVSGNGSYPLVPFSWETIKARGIDVLFLATPHELSRALVPDAEAHGVRVIDLSGAWRLRKAEHRAVYGFWDGGEAAARLDATSVYGLPELHRGEIPDAKVVANPGCYSTSVILGLAPLVRAGVADADHGIICDAKSGVSGAGKTPSQKTHFVEVADNLSAYSVFGHRHTGEILEQLGLGADQLIFTPHLLPIPRGILSTMYVRLRQPMTAAEVHALYTEFYRSCPFVRVFAPGKLPQIQYSVHTNFCDIGFAMAPDGQRLIVVSCLDNLVKGAAGQAVQNMNLMFGRSEAEGLE